MQEEEAEILRSGGESAGDFQPLAPTVFSRSLELGCCDLYLVWEGYLEVKHFSRSWRIHRIKIREKDSSPLSKSTGTQRGKLPFGRSAM